VNLNPKVIKRVMVLAEIFGKTLSDPAARYFAGGLSNYPEEQILRALDRCLTECKHFPSIAEIIERLDDGRPGVNEAWALVPLDESASVVMNDEIAAAYEVARPLLMDGAKTQAFFAFKERYETAVADARAKGKPAKWWPSLGHSVAGRREALALAVAKGRMSLEDARRTLPELPAPKVALPALKQIPQEDAKP
jgi:hypothetical protein